MSLAVLFINASVCTHVWVQLMNKITPAFWPEVGGVKSTYTQVSTATTRLLISIFVVLTGLTLKTTVMFASNRKSWATLDTVLSTSRMSGCRAAMRPTQLRRNSFSWIKITIHELFLCFHVNGEFLHENKIWYKFYWYILILFTIYSWEFLEKTFMAL